MKVHLGREMEGESASREMAMGRWSEERVWMVDHLVSRARWSLAKLRLGEEHCSPVGIRVGESSLMTTYVLKVGRRCGWPKSNAWPHQRKHARIVVGLQEMLEIVVMCWTVFSEEVSPLDWSRRQSLWTTNINYINNTSVFTIFGSYI